ncbi:protein 4.2-like, partial [Pelodytes ibericus]
SKDRKIVECDFQVPKNNKDHRTSDLSGETRLFLRRGQEFTITLNIKSQTNLSQEALEKWTLTVKTGPRPSKLNGTKSMFTISSLGDRKAWNARVVDRDQDLWTIALMSPATATVGNYVLSVKVPSGHVQELGEFMLLFNSWCKDDPVYLYNEAQRQEYVLNEDGIIYLGSESSVQPHPWHFGQFEQEIADISIKFLDMNKNYQKDPEKHFLKRNDPIYVTQVISDVISERDEKDRVAFMVQNGQPSYNWISSVPILQQWFSANTQTAYGHHWVFAAVLCTVLRCLGIPTRIVTNYNSAHDTCETLKKDMYYNENGARIHRSRNDSVWQFHVWNECWMERKDLPFGYSGWQVLDATAQHKYNSELSCSGPAPVRAIKEGCVNWHYDVGLIFSKLVTNCVAWVRNTEGYFIKAYGSTRYVGDSISTKSIGSDTQKDIIHEYKYPKGSAEEYEALQRARQIMLKDQQMPLEEEVVPQGPVVVFMQSQNSQQYGEDIDLRVSVQSVTDEVKDLELVMGVQPVYDYGITRTQFWSEKFHFQLTPGEERSVSGRISPSQYETLLLENNLLRSTALVKEVGKTNIFTVSEQDVTVCKPSLTIQMPKTVLQFQPTKALVVFHNPFKETMKNCLIRVSGKGLLHRERLYRCDDMASRSSVVYPITFTPTAAGTRRLYVQFENSELHVVTTFQRLEVLPNQLQEWSTEHWEKFQKSAKESSSSNLPEYPVRISLDIEDGLLYGQDLNLSLFISNQSKSEKDLCVVLSAQYICEGRDKTPNFWKQEIDFTLEAEEQNTFRTQISYEQYAQSLWESNLVRLTGLVKGITSTISTSRNVTVFKPELTIQMQKEALLYQPITATISITNPLGEILEVCILKASGQGLIHNKRSYGCENIDSGSTDEYSITFAPTKTGFLKLYVEFECRQFSRVNSTHIVKVLPSNI